MDQLCTSVVPLDEIKPALGLSSLSRDRAPVITVHSPLQSIHHTKDFWESRSIQGFFLFPQKKITLFSELTDGRWRKTGPWAGVIGDKKQMDAHYNLFGGKKKKIRATELAAMGEISLDHIVWIKALSINILPVNEEVKGSWLLKAGGR